MSKKITVIPLFTPNIKDREDLVLQKITESNGKMIYFLLFTNNATKFYKSKYPNVDTKYLRGVDLDSWENDLDKHHEEFKKRKDVIVYLFIHHEISKTIDTGKKIPDSLHQEIIDRICEMHNSSTQIDYLSCSRDTKKPSSTTKPKTKANSGITIMPTLFVKDKQGDFVKLIAEEPKTLFIYNDNTCRWGNGGNAKITDLIKKHPNQIGIATGINVNRNKSGTSGIDKRGGFPSLTSKILVGNFKHDGSYRSLGTKNCLLDNSSKITTREIIDRDLKALHKKLREEGYDRIRYSSDLDGNLDVDAFKKSMGQDVINYITKGIQKCGNVDMSDCKVKSSPSKTKKKTSTKSTPSKTKKSTSPKSKTPPSKTKKKTSSPKSSGSKKKCYVNKQPYGFSESSLGMKNFKQGGKYKEGECIFPFTQNGEEYNECQFNPTDKVNICATKVSGKNNEIKEAGICQEVDCGIKRTKKAPRINISRNNLLRAFDTIGKKIISVKGDGDCLFESLNQSFETSSDDVQNALIGNIRVFFELPDGEENKNVLRSYYVSKIRSKPIAENIQQIIGFAKDDDTYDNLYNHWLKRNKHSEDKIHKILVKINYKTAINESEEKMLEEIRDLYLDHMSQPGIWGDEFVANKICEDLDVRLIIYQIRNGALTTTIHSEGTEEIGLYYNGVNHYEAVVSK